MEIPHRDSVCFGQYEVLPAQRQVLAAGQPVGLGARAFDLLLTLIAHRERVLSKDELLELVWPGMVVEENNLTVQISALRKLLGADAITTIAGRGYRFTASVAPPTLDQAPQTVSREGAVPAAQARTPASSGSRVPAPLNALIGRTEAVQETLRLLSTTRCLTFTGAGGSGKTRLALELAGFLQAHYDGCVWWVELANVRDGKALLATIARTLGPPDPSKDAIQIIVERLDGRRALLVLDNCEQVIEECAAYALQLLRTLPELQLLATSRESLRIAGEIAWVVPPLELPSATELAGPPDELTRVAAVQLLVERIRQKNGKFALTELNAPALVHICRELEGLPLALELIAAKVGMQTLEQIAAGLDNSLRLLTGGKRGDLQHHQTMHAAVQWSFDLLSPPEQALFARLSVFAGGWTLGGAQAVCDGTQLAAADVPEILARLERSSVVLAHEIDGAMRFRMLEPIRQFARLQLDASGQLDATQQQLLAWCVTLADAIVPQLAGPGQANGYKKLSAEIDNLRAALMWAKAASLPLGLKLAANLWRFWQVKGHAKELLGWFAEALPLANEDADAVLAGAYNSAGIMARTCGLHAEATRLYGVSLALRRKHGDRRGEAQSLNNLAVTARDQSDHPMVEQYCRESMKIAREIGDKSLEGLGLMHLGTALRGQGQLQEAEDAFQQSFATFNELGDQRVVANLHNLVGELAQHRADWAQARRSYETSLSLNEELDDYWGLALSMSNLASLHLELKDDAAALSRLIQSFGYFRRAGVKHGLAVCFELLAKIARQRGQHQRAAWSWGMVEQIERDTAVVTSPNKQVTRAELQLELEALMPRQSFQDAKAAGKRETLETAFDTVFSDPDLVPEPVKPSLYVVSSGRV